VDPGGTPACILFRHPADEPSDLVGDLRPAAARAGSPTPVQAETGAMPADNGLRLHDDQDALPTRPKTTQSTPEEAVEGVQRRAGPLAFQHSNLLSKGKDFESRVAAPAEENAYGGEDGEDELLHELTVVTWRNRVPDLQSILRASC
jgi:hypothetical protein